jgi:ABC-type amino acid transport substrate-binding protein
LSPASRTTFPGWAIRTLGQAASTGFEADLARALGKKLFGAPGHIELAQVTEDKRIEMLQADMVDMVLS